MTRQEWEQYNRQLKQYGGPIGPMQPTTGAYSSPRNREPQTLGGVHYSGGVPQMDFGGDSWRMPAMIGAGAAGLTGLIGGALTSNQSTNPEDYYYDKDRTAKQRYEELTDWNSGSNRRMRTFLRTMATDAQPTIDTLAGVARMGGLGGGSASSIAFQQGREQARRAGEMATRKAEEWQWQNEAVASRYLGMDYDMLQYGQQMADYAERTNTNWWEELGGAGFGALALML